MNAAQARLRESGRQRAIAAHRRMRQQGLTFRAIGEHFGVSRERGRQLAAKGYRLTWRERIEGAS
jgi:DNA-directed RNA polymerase sigma subunit (sigma70/sigma32)